MSHLGEQAIEPVDGCYACSQAGLDAPFRERFVREGGWRVAHDFNSSLEGWLIIAPLRHVEAFHELTAQEATALGGLLRQASMALQAVTGCEKTYVMLFAEAEGFSHLHVHVVPRMPDLPSDRRGPRVFAYLKDGEALLPEAPGRDRRPDPRRLAEMRRRYDLLGLAAARWRAQRANWITPRLAKKATRISPAQLFR